MIQLPVWAFTCIVCIAFELGGLAVSAYVLWKDR